MSWTQEHQDTALAQGWGVFFIDGDPERPEIQRDDEAAVFDSDIAALHHVIQMADRDDETALLALEVTGLAKVTGHCPKCQSPAIQEKSRGLVYTEVISWYADGTPRTYGFNETDFEGMEMLGYLCVLCGAEFPAPEIRRIERSQEAHA